MRLKTAVKRMQTDRSVISLRRCAYSCSGERDHHGRSGHKNCKVSLSGPVKEHTSNTRPTLVGVRIKWYSFRFSDRFKVLASKKVLCFIGT